MGAEKAKERKAKASPEGVIKAAEENKKLVEADAKRQKELEEETKKREKWIALEHAKERERLASLKVNITVALTHAKNGTATLTEYKLLSDNGVPYRRRLLAKQNEVAELIAH